MSARWTEDDLARLQQHMRAPAPRLVTEVKPSKYRNKPVVIDGKRFASKLEGRCYEALKLRQSAGEVQWFIRQIPFELEGGVVYRADFLAVRHDGAVEVIDATGHLTPCKANKLRQVRARYGVDVHLWPRDYCDMTA